MNALMKLLSRHAKPEQRDIRTEPGANLEAVPGMTSLAEREYLRDYAARVYSGAGAIVDLGCWLGSLTIPLLAGLEKNPASAMGEADIHAYDLFRWADWMKPWQTFHGGEVLKAGETILPEFIRQVEPHDRQKRLLIHAGDLQRLGWSGRPIEMLVVDVMKSWDLANCVARDFYPSLIPGLSYVFHQDYCHYYTPWIHLMQYRLRDHFERVAGPPDSSTEVFRHTRPFTAESLRRSLSFADFSPAEIEAAFEYSLSQLDGGPEWRRQAVKAAEVMVSVHQNDFARARRELSALAASGWAIEGDLKIVQEQLNEK
jgi:hypothetical protein